MRESQAERDGGAGNRADRGGSRSGQERPCRSAPPELIEVRTAG